MNQTLKKELLAQLQHLRTETKEISRLYVANLQRDIVQLIDFLTEQQAAKTRNARNLDPVFVQMKERLDGINLKPEKGRRKDLRRIEDLVRSLRKIAFADKKSE
jgi:site-specific recombinase XerC